MINPGAETGAGTAQAAMKSLGAGTEAGTAQAANLQGVKKEQGVPDNARPLAARDRRVMREADTATETAQTAPADFQGVMCNPAAATEIVQTVQVNHQGVMRNPAAATETVQTAPAKDRAKAAGRIASQRRAGEWWLGSHGTVDFRTLVQRGLYTKQALCQGGQRLTQGRFRSYDTS